MPDFIVSRLEKNRDRNPGIVDRYPNLANTLVRVKCYTISETYGIPDTEREWASWIRRRLERLDAFKPGTYAVMRFTYGGRHGNFSKELFRGEVGGLFDG